VRDWKWTAGLVLLVLLGCARVEAGPRKKEDSRVAESNVELQVRGVEHTPDGLVLTYEVQNRGERPVWLFDRLFDTAPTGHVRLAPHKAYVSIEDGRVVVSRMLHKVPENILVEAPEVPGVTLLQGGETMEERVVLPLPLRESLPYATGKGKELPLSEVRELRLRLGYLVESPDLTLHLGKDSEGVSYKYPSYGPANVAQKVVESGSLTVPSGED